jgi:hypothetical protein
MAPSARISADLLQKHPGLRNLTSAERAEYLRERAAEWWSPYLAEEVDRKWAAAGEARARAARLPDRPLYGRDLRIAEEQRLRRRLKRRYGWNTFPEEPPCRWYERSEEFTGDLRELARVIVTRWRLDGREMGGPERDHLVAEAFDLLDWPHLRDAFEVAARFLNDSAWQWERLFTEAMARHDDALDEETCPRCMGHRDGQAPHRVYIAHYRLLKLYKVGVTTLSSDRRLKTHRSAGASIVDTFITSSYQEALVLEAAVLKAVGPWRTRNRLVPGGGEAWTDDAVLIRLAAFVERGMK